MIDIIDIRSILITWAVFLALKPLVRLRSWWDAIGGAAMVTILTLVLPVVTPNESLQLALTALCGVAVFVGLQRTRGKVSQP